MARSLTGRRGVQPSVIAVAQIDHLLAQPEIDHILREVLVTAKGVLDAAQARAGTANSLEKQTLH